MNNGKGRLFSELERTAIDFGINQALPGIEACRSLMAGESGLKIAVFGRFKAGKSSFLNSLAGAAVLPVGVLPVTGVITELYWAPSFEAEVRFSGRDSAPIREEDIPLYISEEKNPGNEKKVFSVRIGVPGLSCCKGLVFVDTPGMDSIFRHNTETSLNWLPRAGLAILAVSADSPFSEKDLELFKKIIPHCPRTDVLITKADIFSGEEISRIADFIRAWLKKSLGLEARVYPYSVRKDIFRFRKEFLESSILPLLKDPGAEKEVVLSHKIKNIRRYCEEYLSAAAAAAGKNAEERKKYKLLLEEYRSRFSGLKKDFYTLNSAKAGENRSYIESLFISHKKDLQKEISVFLEKEVFSQGGNLLKAVRLYNSAVEKFLSEKVFAVFKTEKDKIEKLLNDSAAAFAGNANDFCSKLSFEAGGILGGRFPDLAMEYLPQSVPAPDIRVSQAFDSHLELLWFLVPSRLLRRNISSHFSERAKFEVEKNLTRMAMNVSETIGKTVEGSVKKSLEHVETTLEAADKILSSSPDNLDEIKKALERIKNISRI